MKRGNAVLALLAAVLVILGLLTVFAIELSNTQAKSVADVKSRVHERGVLAGAVLDSLFETVQQQTPQDARKYGASVVSNRTMNANLQKNAYLALLDSSGRVLAYSRGFTPQARADLKISAAVRLVRSGHPYGLGNLLPYGKTGALDLAVTFPTSHGQRILLTGFTPQTLGGFESNDLRKVPGVKGAHNYLIDANDAVLASTNPARPIGYRFRGAAQLAALSHASGDRNGHYYDEVRLGDSSERLVLSAPNGPLFASVSGLHKWVPWIIFVSFALVAMLAIALAARLLRSSEEVRKANDQLALLNRDLEDANDGLEQRATELARSNAELEQFASIASHDLQEPLRKVRTFTHQLTVTDAEHLSEKGQLYLERANSAAERMQSLIEDLLKFSRVATHGRAFRPVDLGELTREVLEDLEIQLSAAGALVHVGELPIVEGDQLQMRQLMQNLISNAIKFRRDGVVPEVTIGATVADGEARIAVRDNGIGFEPRYAGRIFRVFERLHGRGRYPGTGIGLALCRKIVERHGGELVADSEPGVGSTFTITLPVSAGVAPPPPAAPPAPAAATNGAAGDREEAHVPA